jgi:dihydroceramide fatty acyl 2-hydroxylase
MHAGTIQRQNGFAMPPEMAKKQFETGAGVLDASPRLFANPILDKLSRVHHLTPLLIYAPVVLILLVLAWPHLSVPTILACVLGGYAFWTIAEYWGHRVLFHWQPPGKLGARIHFLVHGVHHVHPSDPLRLVMPPLLSAPLMIAGYFLLRLVCGPVFVLPVAAGFISGYIGYDMVHFHIHNRMPRRGWERFLRRNHMSHHFRDSSRGYGVSAPWWDYVFGTVPATAKSSDS